MDTAFRLLLPDTQAVGSGQCLAIPQQKAAVLSKPGQQHLCHLTPNPPIINGLDQHPLGLHAASVTLAADCTDIKGVQSRKTFFFCGFHTSLT